MWRQHGHAVCRLIDVERDSVLEDPALTLEDGLDQAVDIFSWMKGRLVGIAKARRVFHPDERNASVLGDRSSHLAGCLSLRVKPAIAVLSAHGEGGKRTPSTRLKLQEIERSLQIVSIRSTAQTWLS